MKQQNNIAKQFAPEPQHDIIPAAFLQSRGNFPGDRSIPDPKG